MLKALFSKFSYSDPSFTVSFELLVFTFMIFYDILHFFIYDILNILTLQQIFHLLRLTVNSSKAEALLSIFLYYPVP